MRTKVQIETDEENAVNEAMGHVTSPEQRVAMILPVFAKLLLEVLLDIRDNLTPP